MEGIISRKKKTYVTDSAFVAAWLEATTLNDVVTATGMSYGGVVVKAKRLREAGVKLPELQRSRKSIDVDGLNTLISVAGLDALIKG